MTDLLITNGRVLTQNADREILNPGAVAIRDDRISRVGPAATLAAETDPDRVIDADGGVVIPGLINTHSHVSDILLRGASTHDRGLYDWLLNVKKPGTLLMTPEEYSLAATLYCVEAIQSGTTTFVDNDTEVRWYDLENTWAKLDVYDRLGVRNMYAAGIWDKQKDTDFWSLYRDTVSRNPTAAHPEPDEFRVDTEDAIAGLRRLIETAHDPQARQSIWPAPVVLEGTTRYGLQAAARIAEEYDVRTTTHVAEVAIQERGPISSVEYLHNIGYLGDRTLLVNCVQLSKSDVRLLKKTDTNVAHTLVSNMRLGNGIAPVVSMVENGVTVGVGTDNAIKNDTINPLSDARAVCNTHSGTHADPKVIPAQTAFDMVTRDAATAIGRSADLGSLEAGKQADIAIIDFDHPHLTPSPDPVHTLVHNVQGFEVQTVVCGGDVVLEDRELRTLDRSLADLLTAVEETAASVVERAGIE